MKTRRLSIYPFVALSLALLTVGCGLDAREPSVSPLAAPVVLAESVARDAGKRIGPVGGFVESGGILVEIPPGALQTETSIGIQLRGDGSVDLLPDGQRFACPVRLHLMTSSGKAPGSCSVQWYDPARGIWVTIPSSASGLGRVAPLQHFSLYRMISTVE